MLILFLIVGRSTGKRRAYTFLSPFGFAPASGLCRNYPGFDDASSGKPQGVVSREAAGA